MIRNVRVALRGALCGAVVICTVVACAPALAEDVIIRKFVLEGWTNRPWGPELVRYQVKFAPGKYDRSALVLVGPAGQPVAFQLDNVVEENGKLARATVSFVASLPPEGRVAYLLKQGEPPATPSKVAVAKRGGAFELANEVLAVRVPADSKTFDRPAPAAQVPGPILGVRLADGTWAGEAALQTSRRIESCTSRILADGPVYAEAEVTYAIVPEGFYRLQMRVVDGLDFVVVREAFDFGTMGVGPLARECEVADYLVFNLSKGWRPDTLRGEGPMRPHEQVARAAAKKVEERGGDAYHGAPIKWLKLDEARLVPVEFPLDFSKDHLETRIRLMSPWGDNYLTVAGVLRDADWQKPNAGSVQPHNRELARNMIWAWQENGALTKARALGRDSDFLFMDPDLEPLDPKLKSEVFRGFGAIMRANVGDRQNEAMAALRVGYQMSHWEPDQGHFAFYGKGAPVVPPWYAHYKHSAGVPAGEHTFEVKPFAYPPVWEEQQ